MTCNLLLAAKSVWRHSCSYEHNWLDLIIYIFRNNIYKKRKKRKDTYLDLHPQIHPSQNSRNITLAHSWIYKMLEVSYLSGEVGKAIVSDSVLKTRPTYNKPSKPKNQTWDEITDTHSTLPSTKGQEKIIHSTLDIRLKFGCASSPS